MSEQRPREVKRPGRGGGPVGMPKKGSINFKTVGRLLKLLFTDYPVCIIFMAIFLVANAIIGVIPAIYVEKITSLIMAGLEYGNNLIDSGTAMTTAEVWLDAWNTYRPELIKYLIQMAAIFIAGIGTDIGKAQINAYMTQSFLDKMRTRMFSKMQGLPIKYFDTNTHGDIMSCYTNDIDTLRQLISQGLPSIFSAVITLVVLIGIMMYYSCSLMLVVVVGVILMSKMTKVVGGNSAKYFVRQQQAVGKVEGFIEEMMNGQKVIKVFTHERRAESDFDELNTSLFRDSEKANTYGNVFGPIMNNIGNLLYVATCFFGGILICSGGKIPNISFENIVAGGSILGTLTIPVVATYLGMTKLFTGNVNSASQQITSIAMAIAGAERVFDIIDAEPEEDDGYVTLVNCREENGVITECEERTGHWAWKHPHSADNSVTYTPLRGDVVLDDVDFSYVEGKPVLHNISLYAKPGQKVAFVGATGAGKTTITNLINRFYDIPGGKIRYDGININKIKKADLRHSLGVVLQDVNLFTGTVMDNIRYGKLDATDEECIKAAKLANAHDFITRLPEGYNTMLTSNGANLSQGQRQLISIARAAVADPPVMILDEATSSIDTRTELLVQRGMDALMQGRTVFVIAHRLSTVRNSDAIMVLDHGRIIERGTHEDLIEKKGTYYRLYTGAFELE